MTGDAYRRAFSVLYGIDGGKVRYELRSGNTSTDVASSELFAADGTFDFAAQIQRPHDNPGMASGGTYERAEIDGITGLGTLVHAWQAGNQDAYTRVFQATTTAAASGPDTGYGYFGFGPPLDSAQLGSIVGMWCNWAGPGSLFHTWTGGVANVNTASVQGQTMTRDASSGLFVPDAGGDHITYAPTNSCDATAADVAAGFVYEAFGQSGSPTVDELTRLSPMSEVHNDLVTLGDLGEIPAIPPPAAYAVPAG